MFLLLALCAFAEIPESVRPIAAQPDAPQQFADWTATEGKRSATLVCDPLVKEVLVCFQVDRDGRRGWVSSEHLKRWKVDQAGFLASMRERAATKVEVEKHSVDALEYWTTTSDERWALAGLLRPDVLAKRVPDAELRVVVPLEQTVIAWASGSAELDQIMAVGALEMTETQEGAVSPVVMTIRDGRWSVFGLAVPEAP